MIQPDAPASKKTGYVVEVTRHAPIAADVGPGQQSKMDMREDRVSRESDLAKHVAAMYPIARLHVDGSDPHVGKHAEFAILVIDQNEVAQVLVGSGRQLRVTDALAFEFVVRNVVPGAADHAICRSVIGCP